MKTTRIPVSVGFLLAIKQEGFVLHSIFAAWQNQVSQVIPKKKSGFYF
jgi:hypothetical protein